MSAFALPAPLSRRAAEGTLPHGWIIAGAAEERLEEAAKALAAAFLCAGEGERPCGSCKHCRKVEKGVHPDLQWLEKPADKSQFSVDQVRALRADAYIRPNEASRKVYVLRRAAQMTAEAQNALLKVLEEGPRYAAFLLLSENHLALLPTVRSRCELLRLEAGEDAAGELAQRGGELAGLLLGDDRWRLISWCVPYEKAKREEVLPLWEAARSALLTYRRRENTAKAAALAQTLAEIIAAGNRNGNMGILWGKLWASA